MLGFRGGLGHVDAVGCDNVASLGRCVLGAQKSASLLG